MAQDPVRRFSSDAVGFAAGLLTVVLVVLLDAAVGGRSVPLTATLLGGLVTSAVAGPLAVTLVVLVACLTALLLGLLDELPTDQLVARVLLVAVTGLFSCAVALTRTRREAALARADRAAAVTQTLLRGLLPNTSSAASVEVEVVYRPGQRDLLLGGDFIDVLELGEGRTAFCVGDVSGHGPVAAALGTALRAGWRTQALTVAEPAQWLVAMDRLLTADASSQEQFATALVGYVEDGRVVFANAGHPRPVLLGEGAEVLALAAGPPLGALGGDPGAWAEQQVPVPSGTWGLALYTDGLIEGRATATSRERLGEGRLVSLVDELVRAGRARPEEVVRRLEACNGAPFEDDVALLLLTLDRATAPAPPGVSRERALP